MLFRLWKAAIKDDDTLANEVIRGIYDGMMAFDRERAEDVVDPHSTARPVFQASETSFSTAKTKVPQDQVPIAALSSHVVRAPRVCATLR